MNFPTITGWLTNNPETHGQCIDALESNNVEKRSANCSEWQHTQLIPNSKAYTYQEDQISITLFGHPKIPQANNFSFTDTFGDEQLAAMIAAYRTHGYRSLCDLNGGFSYILNDADKQLVLIAIDRMGIEQMHYATINGQLFYSSSLQSLAAIPNIGNEILPQSIYNYFYFHCIPSPNTIFKNIQKLKPAEVLIFKNGSISFDTYWQPTFNETRKGSVQQLESSVRNAMDACMQEFSKDEQTGAFLSGGTDSSTIAGLLKKYHPTDAPVFSIGFEEQGYDEMQFAEIAVNKFGNKHHKYYVTFDDVLTLLEKIPKIYEEPFGNSSVVPTYAAAQFAKNHGVNHLLGGDGGDELFGGNERYATQQIFNVYSQTPKWFRTCLLDPIFKNAIAGKIPVAKKAKSYIEQASIAMPMRMQTYNILHTEATDSIFDSDYLTEIDPDQPIKQMTETYNEIQDASLLNKMLYLDWKFTLADNDIRKVNTMCRAAGVDVSYPFLDNRVVESSTTVPSKLKIERLKLRSFYKNAYRSFLPTEIINKPKHGFGLPFGVWLNKDSRLQNYVYDSLESLKQRNMFRTDFIENLVDKHRTGHAAYYGTFVWVLAVLELWLQANTKQN